MGIQTILLLYRIRSDHVFYRALSNGRLHRTVRPLFAVYRLISRTIQYLSDLCVAMADLRYCLCFLVISCSSVIGQPTSSLSGPVRYSDSESSFNEIMHLLETTTTRIDRQFATLQQSVNGMDRKQSLLLTNMEKYGSRATFSTQLSINGMNFGITYQQNKYSPFAIHVELNIYTLLAVDWS